MEDKSITWNDKPDSGVAARPTLSVSDHDTWMIGGKDTGISTKPEEPLGHLLNMVRRYKRGGTSKVEDEILMAIEKNLETTPFDWPGVIPEEDPDKYYDKNGMVVLYSPAIGSKWSTFSPDAKKAATDKVIVELFLNQKPWQEAAKRMFELGITRDACDIRDAYANLRAEYVKRNEFYMIICDSFGCERLIRQSGMERA